MKELQIGKTQVLTVLRESEHGLYLGKPSKKAADPESVLLPKGQVPAGTKVGDALTVFVYRDSEDRPVATVKRPAAEVGEFAYLAVKTVTKLGAFLNWGLEKDLFLPYKEMEEPVRSGQHLMVRLYLDKSGRIAASTKLYEYLTESSPTKTSRSTELRRKNETEALQKDDLSKTDCASAFRKEDLFEGAVYRVNPEIGVFVAVCPKGRKIEPGQSFEQLFFGLLPPTEVFEKHRLGERVTGRILRVRADGKLDLSLRKRVEKQIEIDGGKILKKMEEYGGTLPFSENASPELVKRELQMSKGAFKKALGHLYKERKIQIGESTVTQNP